MAVKLKKSSAIGALSLTPLIDIVFLLLVFFLVASRFAEEDRELNVQLPTASEARPYISRPQELELSIGAGGQFFLGAEQMERTRLEQELRDAALNNPTSQRVIVRADRRANWEHVASAINMCQRAGLHDVRPVIQPGDQ